MGIMARKQGDGFVITSDRVSHAKPVTRAPRFSDICQVWTGTQWSPSNAQAMRFGSLEDAEEYIRANYSQVTT